MNYEELISKIPEDEKAEILRLLRELDEAKAREAAQDNFLDFVKMMWPGFISGRHHKIMAEAFERVAKGELKRLIINMPPRHTKPISVLEPVTMGDGKEKILKDVLVGDTVLTHEGRERRVLAVHEQGVIPTVQVTLYNGATINAAPDHPFLTEKGWVKAAELMGHRVKLVPQITTGGGPTDEFALAGYLIGDGSIGLCNNGNGQKASITMADNFQISAFSELCERMGITLKKGSSKYEWHLSGGYMRGKTGTNNTYIRTNEFSVREWLRKNDMVHSSHDKHVPDFVKCGTKDQVAAFLGAYFSCDGTVANRQKHGGIKFGYTTVSKKLADEVHRLLMRLGIYWVIRETKTQVVYKGERKFGIAWSIDTQSFGEARKFFEIIGPYIQNSKRDRMVSELSRAPEKVKLGDGFSKVKSVVAAPSAECRCLEVEEDHSFVCAGMVVHNSEFASYLLPAWYLGRHPERKIIQTAHTSELAVGFGRKVRNLVGSADYQKVFGGVGLQSDSKAAGRWSTNKGGEYFAIGVGGAVTGKGADLLIIDDAHSEQEAMIGQFDASVYDKVFEWYSSGPRQRLQPGGAIVIVMTRWAKRDLTGQILDSAIKKEGASEWEVIELPAIMPSGEPLWPEFWALEELERLKAELPISKWAAQYQQDPTSEEGALIKRDWWNVWEGEKAPPCEAVITAMDTAFSKTERSDYSACVSFGIFQHPNSTGKLIPNLILLDAWKDKLEFPELKATTVQYYKDWKPDMFIVEKKASGAPLIAELRNAGVPVQEFTPTRATGDKIVRVNSITDIFASGVVWAPEDRFAEEVVEECAAFPSGDHDDYVDAVTMALMRFRQGGFVLPTDEEDIIDLPQFRKEPYY